MTNSSDFPGSVPSLLKMPREKYEVAVDAKISRFSSSVTMQWSLFLPQLWLETTIRCAVVPWAAMMVITPFCFVNSFVTLVVYNCSPIKVSVRMIMWIKQLWFSNVYLNQRTVIVTAFLFKYTNTQCKHQLDVYVPVTGDYKSWQTDRRLVTAKNQLFLIPSVWRVLSI